MAAKGIAQLERIADRGELVPVCLLLRSLRQLAALEPGCVGGDALLWMVSPVLEAARRQIQQDSYERRSLHVEADCLRQNVEILSLEVEDQRSQLQREEERLEARLERHHQQRQELRRLAETLKGQRQEVEALRQEMDREALRAEKLWEREEAKLEEELQGLVQDVEEVKAQLERMASPRSKAQARLEAVAEELTALEPELSNKETVRQTNARLEVEIDALEKEIGQLQKKRGSRVGTRTSTLTSRATLK